jgi:hypothetical protein
VCCSYGMVCYRVGIDGDVCCSYGMVCYSLWRDGDMCCSYHCGLLHGGGETVMCAAVTIVACYTVEERR